MKPAPFAAALILLGLPASAWADDPTAVLERYRAWRGGAAFEQLTAVRATGAMTGSGLAGVIEQIATTNGDLRRDIDLGVVRTASARRRTEGWTLTPAGQVEDIAPAAAEDLRRDALLMFEAVLDDLSRLDRKADAVRDGRTFAVVAVDFGDDDIHELYIDPDTGALHGLRRVRDRREAFVRFDDWRVVEGVRMPFAEISADGLGEEGAIRWTAVDANPDLPDDAFARPAHAAAHVIDGAAASSGFMPFDLYAGVRIYIPAVVNGVETEVLLDSGAEMTVLDKAFAERLGLSASGEVAAVGTGGVGSAQFAPGVTIGLDGITFPDRTVAVVDLAAIGQAIGRPLPVVLGKDAFNGLIIDIDFPARRLAFHERQGFVAPEGLTEVPLVSTGALRAVALSVEGRPPALFDFDTGNGGALIIYPAYAGAEGLLDGRRASTVMSGAVGGMRESGIATIQSVGIAGFELRDVPAVFPPAGPSAVDSDRTAGNVGMGVLGRFRLVTDFAGGRLWLGADSSSLEQPFARDRLGLSLRKDGAAIVVQRVSPNSPAAEAGWTGGERITAIDGVAAAGLDAAALRAVVTGPAGRTVSLTLESGQTRTLESRDFY
ncbi:aspartyl protease family protein [Brevundimonas sp.]|uniref:aspartyl protease family protein n=1 Tax=Brevundimonas sp. TaxID=1871086 RepID=UPI002D63B977|nr:aspartyl protease family protein [Brevundimonas sp.]HYD28798.1 aspartyl protease family protein [Brevundimonas sp.]